VAVPPDPGVDRPIIFEEVHAVASPFADRVRLGGTMEFAGDNPKFDQRRVEAIVSSLRRFIDLRWDERFDTWAGSRPMSPDGLPYLGRPSKWKNVVVAAGHGMYGLSLAAPTAQVVADLVAGERPRVDLSPFSPDR
jgi:D-amino-acid dehydrogenase